MANVEVPQYKTIELLYGDKYIELHRISDEETYEGPDFDKNVMYTVYHEEGHNKMYLFDNKLWYDLDYLEGMFHEMYFENLEYNPTIDKYRFSCGHCMVGDQKKKIPHDFTLMPPGKQTQGHE